MTTNLLMVAMAIIPTGVAVMVWGSNIGDDKIIFASWGMIGAGLLAWFGSFALYKKEQAKIDNEKSKQSQKEDQRHQELLAEIKGLREDLKKQ